jgi:hypothetical protein
MMKNCFWFNVVTFFSLWAFGGVDHTLYYKGLVHYTDLTGHASLPSDEMFILKKEILPSKGTCVETATMHDYKGQMSDLTLVMNIKGNAISATSADGSTTGVGFVRTAGDDGDFSYLEMTFVIKPIGSTVKNINYITPTKLIARKQISNSEGTATALWESDMDLIPEGEYQSLYKNLHAKSLPGEGK